MTDCVQRKAGDRLVVELTPDENDLNAWTLLAMLADHLERNFGVDLDCDWVEVHLVYGQPEDGPQDRPQGSES